MPARCKPAVIYPREMHITSMHYLIPDTRTRRTVIAILLRRTVVIDRGYDRLRIRILIHMTIYMAFFKVHGYPGDIAVIIPATLVVGFRWIV
jgi:hypothetical protein